MTRYATELIVTISLLQVMMFYPHNFVCSARYMYFHHYLYLTEYLSTVLNQEGNTSMDLMENKTTIRRIRA